MLLYPRLTDLDRQSEEQAENSIMMISDSPVQHLNQALFDKANHHGKPEKTSEYFAEQNLPCDVTTLGFEVDEKNNEEVSYLLFIVPNDVCPLQIILNFLLCSLCYGQTWYHLLDFVAGPCFRNKKTLATKCPSSSFAQTHCIPMTSFSTTSFMNKK